MSEGNRVEQMCGRTSRTRLWVAFRDVSVGIIEFRRKTRKGLRYWGKPACSLAVLILQPIDYHVQFLRPRLGIGLSDLISAVSRCRDASG